MCVSPEVSPSELTSPPFLYGINLLIPIMSQAAPCSHLSTEGTSLGQALGVRIEQVDALLLGAE